MSLKSVRIEHEDYARQWTHPVSLCDPLRLRKGLQPPLKEGLNPPGGVNGLTLPTDDKSAMGTETNGAGGCQHGFLESRRKERWSVVRPGGLKYRMPRVAVGAGGKVLLAG